MAGDGVSRRDLLMFWRRGDPAAEGENAPSASRSSPPRPQSVPPPRAASVPPPPPRVGLLPLRPPGALDEADFLATCARCGRCVDACPVDAIAFLTGGATPATPAIDASAAPCVVCDDLACTHVCPSGALRPMTDRLAIRMGTATIDASWCIAMRGGPCRTCVDVCPIPGALKLVPGAAVYVPEVDASACVGCGVCEHSCPTRPRAIYVSPRAAD